MDCEGSRGVKVRVGKAWQSMAMVGATMVEKAKHALVWGGGWKGGLEWRSRAGGNYSSGSRVIPKGSGPQ